MRNGERAQAVISEFAARYFFAVAEEDGEVHVGMSDAEFARKMLPRLEDAISQAEHHAGQNAKRDAPPRIPPETQEPVE